MSIRYSKLFKIPRRAVKYILAGCYPFVVKIWTMPKVASIDETLDKIIKNRCSISRFGDGEFLYIIDQLNLPFQKQVPELRQKMINILKSKEPDILVGFPIGYYSVDNLKKNNRLTWKSQISWIYPRLQKYVDLDKQYFNASMTRPYEDYEDKSNSKRYFEKLMRIWENREVLLVEGEKSRLGVGNDLFDNAVKVERVLAPMHHAYDKYNELINEIKKHNFQKLILIALGPTATAMAYDVAKLGYQAIDIGNVDIEYEWYLRNAVEKVKIPGKYTSEAIGGRMVEDIYDKKYLSQIIAKYL
ncbi:MAG: GT-D fold domain-containing glycosyltransferase [Paludibacter sp.]|nr:GT-D fold domain-containing glycosyltransferase [Paludibacter sp.]